VSILEAIFTRSQHSSETVLISAYALRFLYLYFVMCVRTNITHFSGSAFKRGYKHLHSQNGEDFQVSVS